MRILYGVQATGNGHITRANAMLPALRRMDIHADFLFSGRKGSALFDMQQFGNFITKRGFTYITDRGRVRWGKTLASARPLRFIHDVRDVSLAAYDYVITDFEPISAWAARYSRVPSIGLAHQYALCYPLPGAQKNFWLRHAIRTFAPADQLIGIHWQHFDAPILPPLISINADCPTEELGFILVYLPFEDLTEVTHWLKAFPEYEFRIYAAVDNAQKMGHIHILPLSRTQFPQDLARCSGIVCNAGFGLCSEAMVLGKKLLVRPLQGQVEQGSNAAVLAAMNRAHVMHGLDAHALRQWLPEQGFEKTRYPDVAHAIAQRLTEDCRHFSPERWVKSVWQNHSENKR